MSQLVGSPISVGKGGKLAVPQAQAAVIGARHGIVKHWNEAQGFGFIEASDGTDTGGADVFVGRAVLREGARSLTVGLEVQFDMEPSTDFRNAGKAIARNVSGPALAASDRVPQEGSIEIGVQQEGTVRKWNDDKGFGFIAPSKGGADIFVRRVDLPCSMALMINQRVIFTPMPTGIKEGQVMAKQVQIPGMQFPDPALGTSPALTGGALPLVPAVQVSTAGLAGPPVQRGGGKGGGKVPLYSPATDLTAAAVAAAGGGGARGGPAAPPPRPVFTPLGISPAEAAAAAAAARGEYGAGPAARPGIPSVGSFDGMWHKGRIMIAGYVLQDRTSGKSTKLNYCEGGTLKMTWDGEEFVGQLTAEGLRWSDGEVWCLDS